MLVTMSSIDFCPDNFKIIIKPGKDENISYKIKNIPSKESSNERKWFVDLKDYRSVLENFNDYKQSEPFKKIVEKLEKSGGSKIIPDILIKKNDYNIKVVMLGYNSEVIASIQKISERVYDEIEKCWYFPKGLLKELINGLSSFKLYIDKELKDDAKNIVGELKEERKRTRDNTKLLEASQVELDYNFKKQPFLHQKIGVKFLIENDNCGLFDEQGLGKTAQLIWASDILRNMGLIEKVIVVCPNSVKYPWGNEIFVYCDLDYKIIDGLKAKRDELFKEEVFFFVINYELLRIEEETILKIMESHKTLIIFDESQKIKNRKAKTTKIAHRLSEQAKRVFIATGTPVANKPEDLWSQIYTLDKGKLFGDYFSFLKEYCKLGNNYSKWAILGYKNLNKLREKLQAVSIRRLKKTTIDLPEKLYQVYNVSLKDEQQKIYQAFRFDLVEMIKALSEEAVEKLAQNILVKMLRLSQISSNPRLIDSSFSGEIAKLTELDTLIEDLIYDDRKLVLWTSYVENIALFKERYSKYKPVVIYGAVSAKEREEVVHSFQNDPEVKIFIGNPKAAREGITLTAADIAIYFDRTFNAADYWQSQDRIHRIGQKGCCTIINLVAKDTIDEYIDEVLQLKKQYSSSSLGDDDEGLFNQLKVNKDKLLKILG